MTQIGLPVDKLLAPIPWNTTENVVVSKEGVSHLKNHSFDSFLFERCGKRSEFLEDLWKQLRNGVLSENGC